MKCVVIGDGGWGTALAMVLHQNGHDVTVWGPFEETLKTIRETGENPTFLPDVPLPDGIEWTTDTAVAGDADLAVLAVPTKYYRDVTTRFAGIIKPSTLVVSVAKGLDKDSHHRMSEVAAEILGLPDVAALSGPSHAEEVARGILTAVTVAARDRERATRIQEAFANPRFRVYTADDVIGVELGGALKNVIAIAVGMSDGLGFGDNTRAALITRGLSEMTRLGCAVGAQAKTFSGLSGLGDLIVTCTSKLSRNRSVGERIGRGEKVDDILGGMAQATEGIWNCASARALAHAKHIDAPVTEQVYAIVHEGRDPREAVASLMSRDVRAE